MTVVSSEQALSSSIAPSLIPYDFISHLYISLLHHIIKLTYVVMFNVRCDNKWGLLATKPRYLKKEKEKVNKTMQKKRKRKAILRFCTERYVFCKNTWIWHFYFSNVSIKTSIPCITIYLTLSRLWILAWEDWLLSSFALQSDQHFLKRKNEKSKKVEGDKYEKNAARQYFLYEMVLCKEIIGEYEKKDVA